MSQEQTMNSSSSGSTPISPAPGPARLSGRLTSSSSDATCGGAPTWNGNQSSMSHQSILDMNKLAHKIDLSGRR